MKNLLYVFIAVLGLTGCSSYTELAKWKSDVPIDDGEVPIATFTTSNVSYQLFGIIPLCSSVPLTAKVAPLDDYYWEFNVEPFADNANIDGCLDTLRYALKLSKSNRVDNICWFSDNDRAWSLFIVTRHTESLSCIILKPEFDK